MNWNRTWELTKTSSALCVPMQPTMLVSYETTSGRFMEQSQLQKGLFATSFRRLMTADGKRASNDNRPSLALHSRRMWFCAEFKIWKHSVEESTASYFVQERGKQKMADGSAAINFVCHRSGSYAPKGFGKRPLKLEGSCKMGNRCTAEVICRIYPDNRVKVTYYDLHHGHNMDGRHLKMTRKERAMYRCRIMGKRSSDRVKKVKKQPSPCVKIENKPNVNSSNLVLPITICEISNSENGNEMPVAIDLASDNSKYTNLNESVSSSHTNLNEAIDKKLLHALALLRDRNVLDDKITQLVASHLDAVVLLLEGSKDSAPLPTRSHEQPHSEYSSRRNKTTSNDNAITAATSTHKTTNPQCFVVNNSDTINIHYNLDHQYSHY
uniref:Uncharacterized protein n=1 Tax=Timema poppense TaxID=170557 RepID=A0A7R9CNP8_TIMPO|nr:unnamed protein product [Timema poppensis]